MDALTFLNDTPFTAQFFASKGQLLVNRLPLMASGSKFVVPSNETYQVTATMIHEDNTYESAPVTMNGSMVFLAQLMDNFEQRTFDLEIKVEASTPADQMVFKSTTSYPVTFEIAKLGKTLHHVVVQNSFVVETLTIDSAYTIYAVINGITTRSVQTCDPSAVVTALADDGHFALSVS